MLENPSFLLGLDVITVDYHDCDVNYIRGSGRKLDERLMDHGVPRRNKNSHVLKQSVEKGHKRIPVDDMTIISKKTIKIVINEKCQRLYLLKQKSCFSIHKIILSLPNVLIESRFSL